MEEENKVEEKKIHAKTVSLFSKILCGVGIVVCHILKWTGILVADSMEICIMWLFVYGVLAGTIDVNIIIDKFRSK